MSAFFFRSVVPVDDDWLSSRTMMVTRSCFLITRGFSCGTAMMLSSEYFTRSGSSPPRARASVFFTSDPECGTASGPSCRSAATCGAAGRSGGTLSPGAAGSPHAMAQQIAYNATTSAVKRIMTVPTCWRMEDGGRGWRKQRDPQSSILDPRFSIPSISPNACNVRPVFLRRGAHPRRLRAGEGGLEDVARRFVLDANGLPKRPALHRPGHRLDLDVPLLERDADELSRAHQRRRLHQPRRHHRARAQLLPRPLANHLLAFQR